MNASLSGFAFLFGYIVLVGTASFLVGVALLSWQQTNAAR